MATAPSTAASGGALGWLDSLMGSAVNWSAAVGQVKANLKAPQTLDQNPIAWNSPVQVAGTSIPPVWILGGVVAVAAVAALLLRR